MAVMSKSAKSSAWLPRVIDLLLYVLIAIVVIGSVFAYAVYQAKAGHHHARLPLKWMAFAGLTLVVFGYTLQGYRGFWGRRLFWVVLCVSLLVHLGLGLVLIRQFDTIPLVLFAMAGSIETVLLENSISAALRRWPGDAHVDASDS
jgi:hypothetical protein